MTARLALPAALFAIAGGLFATTKQASAQPPSFAHEVPAIREGKPVLAFNGKDLTGFYTYTKGGKFDDPKHVFSVVDGQLRISGEDYGGVITRAKYRDYHLVVEWKWGAKTWGSRAKAARDSGILLHCVGPDGAAGGQWMESIECQIIEGGCGDFIMVGGLGQPQLTCATRLGPDKQRYYEKGGEEIVGKGMRFNWWGRDPAWKDVLGYRGPRDVEKPAGEWNRMEVVCDGDAITNIVNGYVVNVGTKSSLTEGKILIQSEGAEIIFRKIEVRPLVK
ncbi:MAG: DUF1080 domain-containing protein [Planctomycetota bacterium]|nr:DUF1080 domain-containing protein [Planctomycetota bacterium]